MPELKISVNKKSTKSSKETIDLRGEKPPAAAKEKPAPPPSPEPPVQGEKVAFRAHSLSSDNQLKKMEKEIEEEVKGEVIDESLSEIYQDDDGRMVDVKKLDIKKKHGFVYWFFMLVFILSLAGGAGYAAYYLYNQKGTESAMVEFEITGPGEVLAGEETFFSLNYKNISNVDIKSVRIEAIYPENFKFISAEPAASAKDNVWEMPIINAHRSGTIRIRAYIVGPVDKANIINGKMSYVPANFSSQFSKDSTFTATVKDLGIDFEFDHIASALVRERNEASVSFTGQSENALKDFTIMIEPSDNVEFFAPPAATSTSKKKTASSTSVTMVKPNEWKVENVSGTEEEIKFYFAFKDRTQDAEKLVIRFIRPDGEREFEFLEKTLDFEVVKNNLNLTMIMNGARDSAGIDFGQTLNFSVVYSNKGDAEMKDVMIMAVLDGDFLDWTSLKDASQGVVQSNSITWSKSELAGLAAVGVGAEGTIDFSINVASTTEIDVTKDYELKSYAQFMIGADSAKKPSDEMKSNTVTAKINSDTKFKETVRYFDDDNIAVGSGPLPPKVGQTTGFKVYWTVTNNLHELGDMKIETKLPANVKWEDKNRATVGTIQYMENENKVVWNIGRMPISVPSAEGEFNVSVTPAAEDADKIMVLLTGSNLTGTDNATKGAISKSTKSKTTRLEDDPIANIDGIIIE